MKDIHLWKFIRSHLSKNHPVILITVVENQKGSPGKQGFKMAVSKNKEVTGSIGGGVMEFNLINDAVLELKNTKSKHPKVELEKLYHNKRSAVKRSGLICAGTQTNATLMLHKNDLTTINKILKASENNINGLAMINKDGLSFKTGKQFQHFLYRYKNENDWSYEERVGYKETVVIAGCGHVGLAVSRQMSMLGFEVIVTDDRKDLSFISKNKFADKIIIDSYQKLGSIASKYPDAFYVIVTTGFHTDKIALNSIIKKKIRYIGLMGTTAKVKKIFHESLKEGVSRALLRKVHAPIGIGINSDTPEEIAVSIAAEIIKQKNNISE